MAKIAYVKHPVSRELKNKVRGEGFRIIDAKFAPKGAEIYAVQEEEKAEEVKPAPRKRGRPRKEPSE